MIVFHVRRAVSGGALYIPRVQIEIDEEVEIVTGADWIEKQTKIYDEDAAIIARVMIKSLPGGTLDRLLVKLLEHYASLHATAHEKDPG